MFESRSTDSNLWIRSQDGMILVNLNNVIGIYEFNRSCSCVINVQTEKCVYEFGCYHDRDQSNFAISSFCDWLNDPIGRVYQFK